jgi:hypothetical protein
MAREKGVELALARDQKKILLLSTPMHAVGFPSLPSPNTTQNPSGCMLANAVISSLQRSASASALPSPHSLPAQNQQPNTTHHHADRCCCSLSQPKLNDPTPVDGACPVDDRGYPVPRTFSELVLAIQHELGSDKGLTDLTPAHLDRLQAIMTNYDSNKADWDRYAFYDPYRYTRNLIDDGNGKYNLLLLCWGPQHASPIHDHAGSHCILKVMDGGLSETRYAWPEASQATQQPMDAIDVVTMQRNQAAYMHGTFLVVT